MRIPVAAAIIFILLSVLVDLYNWLELRKVRGVRDVWTRAYAVTSVLLWCFMTVVLLLPKRDADRDIIPIMWMVFSYMSVYIPKTVYAVCSLIGRIPTLWKGKSLSTGFYLGVPLSILVFVLMWWGALVTRNDIDTRYVTVVSPALPDSFAGYRIVQFSDAHVGTWSNDTAFVSKLVRTINELHPDLVVFTGDVVNRSSQELYPFLNILGRLTARDGVYSVMGNHDYGDYTDWPSESDHEADISLMRRYQKFMGWRQLKNEHVFISRDNDSIALIGVENWGEPPFKQYGDLNAAYTFSPDSAHNVNDSLFKILLSHNPEHWRREVSHVSNIDLTLSGHTHAMQMIIGAGERRWSPSAWRYEEWGGLYERENSSGRPVRIYVNIGCGEVGFPARIGATPELTVITLQNRGNGTKSKFVDTDDPGFTIERRKLPGGRK